MEYFVGVGTVGVATLGVVSCGIPRLITQNMASCVGIAMPIVGAVVVVSYVSCRVEGYVSLNIMVRITPKPKIFTDARTQDSFQVCFLSSCNHLSEWNKFWLGAVLLLCLVLELHKSSSLGLERRTDFDVVAFVTVISSSKQTTLVLAPFFCRA
jgi:hypothetical protein